MIITNASRASEPIAWVMFNLGMCRDAPQKPPLDDSGLKNLDFNWEMLGQYCDATDDIAEFEKQLRFDPSGRARQVRDRHVLLRTRRYLNGREAAEAEDDPRLVAVKLRDGAPGQGFRLDVWYAGCACCGRAFELDAAGGPVADGEGAQLALFAPGEGEPAGERQEKGGRAQGTVACPRCGWRSQLARDARELVVTCNWPIVRVEPSLTPLEWKSRAQGTSYSISPGRFDLELDFSSGAVAYKPAGRWHVLDMAGLEEYPIWAAVDEALRAHGIRLNDLVTDPLGSADNAEA